MTSPQEFELKLAQHSAAVSKANSANKIIVFDALSAAGITHIAVGFDGEGDQGQIDNVAAHAGSETVEFPATTITLHRAQFGCEEPTTHEITLREAVEELCYGYLEQEYAGWENNDGAFGLGVSQKTAWFMLHRIREAMQDKTATKLAGEVEVDESFIGGKARNMHREKRERVITGTGGKDKAIALGMVERGGKVRTFAVPNRRKHELHGKIRENITAGTALFSDSLQSYNGLSADYKHAVVDHAIEYARGNVHTNTMENFWSLVKRQLHGTYISVEPFHLFRYLDEQSFRYNGCKLSDAERFAIVCSQVADRRLTWDRLTGKDKPE